jgi:hypothetical protein
MAEQVVGFVMGGGRVTGEGGVIGCNFADCVAELVKGMADKSGFGFLERVVLVLAGESEPFTDEEGWKSLLIRYGDIYWTDFPEMAAAIANELRSTGRLWQPVVEVGKDFYPLICDDPCQRHENIWVADLRLVRWSREPKEEGAQDFLRRLQAAVDSYAVPVPSIAA